MVASGPVSRYFAEFVGTFMLVFSVGCNVLSGSATWAVLSIACTLMVLVYALGDISGANLNPAVSVSLGIAKKLDWTNVAIYCVMQLLGGLMAGLCLNELFAKSMSLAPGHGYQWYDAALVEFVYTCMLCFVVLNVAASKPHAGKNQFYGLAIGFVAVAGGYGAGHISGGCFNPAVALGIDIEVPRTKLGISWFLVYAWCEVLGGAVAALLFVRCRPDEPYPDVVIDWSVRYPVQSVLLSEFLGTYLLVFTVGLNVLGGSLAPVMSIASALLCMVFALGSVSGAHFNPAVTLSIVSAGRGKIAAKDAINYVGVQLAGGFAGACTYWFVEEKTFPLEPAPGYSLIEACFVEMVFTFYLAFVVLSVATVRQGLDEFFGLAIGAAVIAGGLAIGRISGGSLNPAVSFAIALSHGFAVDLGRRKMMTCLCYMMAELVGGALAAAVFMKTHPTEFVKGDEDAVGPA